MLIKGLIYGDKWQLTNVETDNRYFLRHIVSERIICLTKQQLESVERGEVEIDKLISHKLKAKERNKLCLEK